MKAIKSAIASTLATLKAMNWDSLSMVFFSMVWPFLLGTIYALVAPCVIPENRVYAIIPAIFLVGGLGAMVYEFRDSYRETKVKAAGDRK